MMSTEVKSVAINTYVNCVKFFGNCILASAGNTLQVYNAYSSELVEEAIIFPSQRIHEIVINDRVLIFGGFHLALVDIGLRGERVSVSVVHTWTAEQWVQDARFFDNSSYAVLGSSNVLYVYQRGGTGLVLERKFQCQERSVLYSGQILGTSWSDCVVLCGTVFSQITVWSPTLNDNHIVHRLIGHQGVIFSVTYHEGNATMCSTSDDRSLRIWKVEMKSGGSLVERWAQAKITLRSSIFGHTARVWRSIQLSGGRVISIGEDGQMKVWNGDKCEHSWSCHQNGNVWSLDYNESTGLVVTGGGDGGICLWPLSDSLREPKEVKLELDEEDFPRQILRVRKKLLIYTNSGMIVSQGQHVRPVLRDVRFRSFCILSLSANETFYSAASIAGDVVIFNAATDERVADLNVGNGKIFSLHWLDEERFLTCQGEGSLTLYQLNEATGTVSAVLHFALPYCKERWTTAAVLAERLLICGDRDGSIHAYNVHTHRIVTSYRKVHSRLGVSCIEYDRESNTLTSVGRDGLLRHWEIRSNMSDVSVRKVRVPNLKCKERCSGQDSDTNEEDSSALTQQPKGPNLYDGTNNSCIEQTSDSDKEVSSHPVQQPGEFDSSATNCGKSSKCPQTNSLVSNVTNVDDTASPHLHQISADKLPLEWPARIHRNPDGDIYILGFHEVHFVIWSHREQKIILKLKCGGGHRSWDFTLEGSRLYFSFIKQKRVFSLDLDLNEVTRPAVAQSFHRDEINALVCLDLNGEQLIISGGEDNTLRVSSLCRNQRPYDPSPTQTSHPLTTQTHYPSITQTNHPLTTQTSHPLITQTSHPLTTQTSHPSTTQTSHLSTTQINIPSYSLRTHLNLRSHISSIRSLAFDHRGEDVYLVSGGGRAQLKIWKLSSRSDSASNFLKPEGGDPPASQEQVQKELDKCQIAVEAQSKCTNSSREGFENPGGSERPQENFDKPLNESANVEALHKSSICPQDLGKSSKGFGKYPLQYQCKELLSHMLNGEDRKRKSWKQAKPRINPETRYMDLAAQWDAGNLHIAAACSDGYVRVFTYRVESNEIELVRELSYHGQCVLGVHFVRFESRVILCSMSTRGDVALWDLKGLIERGKGASDENINVPDNNSDSYMGFNNSEANVDRSNLKSCDTLEFENCSIFPTRKIDAESPATEINKSFPRSKPKATGKVEDIRPVAQFQLHEGGINSFDARCIQSSLFLVSGGDDCSLVLTRLSPDLTRTGWVRILQAHDSQITGVRFVNDERLVSASVDQKIIVWAWRECDFRRSGDRIPSSSHIYKGDKNTGDIYKKETSPGHICKELSSSHIYEGDKNTGDIYKEETSPGHICKELSSSHIYEGDKNTGDIYKEETSPGDICKELSSSHIGREESSSSLCRTGKSGRDTSNLTDSAVSNDSDFQIDSTQESEKSNMQLIRVATFNSCIPDIHGLNVMGEDKVCVFGCGVQISQIVDSKSEAHSSN